MKRTLLILILLLALCAGCAETPPSAKPSAAPTQTPNPTVDPAVYLDGVFCSRAAQVLPLSGKNVTAAELSAALAQLSEVRRVELRGVPFTSRERAALREAYPSVVFQWPVEVLGETFLSTDTTISFAGREDLPDNAADAICAAAGEFYDLRLVDLSGCGLDSDTLCALRESLGGADVRWDFELCGVPVSSTDREIDLSGKKLKGRVEEIEVIKQGAAVTVYLLPNLFVTMGLTVLVVFLGTKTDHRLLAGILILTAAVLALLSYRRVMVLAGKR